MLGSAWAANISLKAAMRQESVENTRIVQMAKNQANHNAYGAEEKAYDKAYYFTV